MLRKFKTYEIQRIVKQVLTAQIQRQILNTGEIKKKKSKCAES